VIDTPIMYRNTDLSLHGREATYFERAHSFMPLLHRNRFHSWADLDVITPSQACLRAAVWTVGAALCPRFHNMYMSLYTHTRQLLQALEGGEQGHLWAPVGTLQLEQIQAWLLIGHCDFIRHDRHAAVLSAAKISRLVQAAGFNLRHTGDSVAHDTGLLTPNCAGNSLDITLKEERGRAFWVAFCFDRMVHSLDHCHFTLQDETVSKSRLSRLGSLANQCPDSLGHNQAYLPLPWPEDAYQASEPTVMHTLSEVLKAPRVDMNACFAESIVAITLYGRCVTHRRLAAAAKARKTSMLPDISSGTAAGDGECQRRHAWLIQALDLRFRSGDQSPLRASTPLLILAHLLNHGCTVYLLETLVEHMDDPELHVDQVYKAYNSVVSIAEFATTLPQAACFKVSPSSPMAANIFALFEELLNSEAPDASTRTDRLVARDQLSEEVQVYSRKRPRLGKHKSNLAMLGTAVREVRGCPYCSERLSGEVSVRCLVVLGNIHARHTPQAVKSPPYIL
jgi:hypothetical protein